MCYVLKLGDYLWYPWFQPKYPFFSAAVAPFEEWNCEGDFALKTIIELNLIINQSELAHSNWSNLIG